MKYQPWSVMPLAALMMLPAPSVLFAADQNELNLYSSRHYDTDEALYREFEEQTGIKINRIEASGDELIERIKLEGETSPADVLVTVDAGRLWRAQEAGILAPVESDLLDAAIPEYLRHEDGLWYGFSTRARVIYYDKERIDPALIQSYEQLADPALKGEICIRSSSNIYNLSLLSSIIAHDGQKVAKDWAEGVVANFARPPEGNDTAQIRAVAAGTCGVSVGNTYYFARLLNSDEPEDIKVVEKVGFVFPGQEGNGTHVNISGAGMLKHAPNPDAAKAFLEYLASPAAQAYFANGNNEFSVVEGTQTENKAFEIFGAFKADDLNVSALGSNQPQAQITFDLAGWK